MNSPDHPPRKLGITRTPDEAPQDVIARLALHSETNAGITVNQLAGRLFGAENVDAPGCVQAIETLCKQVSAGELTPLERMLAAQAVTLDLLFQDQARRALAASHASARELELKLALKAQAQCRATVEALAEIKNPMPKVFTRQANITSGPQQVNNSPQPARGKKSGSQSNELMEVKDAQNEWLDAGAAGKTGRTDPAMAAVDARHRPEN